MVLLGDLIAFTRNPSKSLLGALVCGVTRNPSKKFTRRSSSMVLLGTLVNIY